MRRRTTVALWIVSLLAIAVSIPALLVDAKHTPRHHSNPPTVAPQKRTTATFAPSDTRVVVMVATTAHARPGSPRTRTVAISRATDVRHLVADYNALPPSPASRQDACKGAGPLTSYMVEFRTARAATPRVVATIHPCRGISTSILGQTGPPLEDGAFRADVLSVFGDGH